MAERRFTRTGPRFSHATGAFPKLAIRINQRDQGNRYIEDRCEEFGEPIKRWLGRRV